MKKIMFSPDAKQKLVQIREEITFKYGAETAKKIISKMLSAFGELQMFENKGSSVESIIGVPCDYRILYVQHNYAFYRVEQDTIWIVDLYNEREDFMWKLFGIRTISLESEDYWNT